jgi:uncharacterized Zn finger protein
VEQTNNEACAQAMNLVHKIRPLLLANGGEPRWNEYRAELRAKFKAKRKFHEAAGRAGIGRWLRRLVTGWRLKLNRQPIPG